MTYHQTPDRNEIYRNTRAKYPAWPARHALHFANECMGYRFLHPGSSRPCAIVKYTKSLDVFHADQKLKIFHRPNGTVGANCMLYAPEMPSNPWGREYETEYLYGTWRCYRFTNREDGVRLLATSEQGHCCDMWQDRVAQGIVVGLPAKDGLTKLLVGYQYTDKTYWIDDGYVQLRVDSWVTATGNEYEERPDDDTLAKALRSADEHARCVAEADREDAARQEAERQIDEKKDEICELFKTRHADGIDWAREQIGELRQRIRDLTDRPWIVEYGY